MTMTTQDLFDKLQHVKIGGTTCLFTEEKCERLVPQINRINQIKAEKNAIILAHSYVSPEVLYGVADFTGDSYELSKKARESDADIIVFAAVKFMAESAKLLNPDKTVLIPSKNNGCSLADSISGEQVRTLRAQYPDHAFVCYINTTADVKAQCDVCVTSSNVYHIIERIENDKIYFLPDKLMAENVIADFKKRGIHKQIDYWDGTCYVHEEYDADMIHYLRNEYADLEVLSHPECNTKVLDASDYVGSTSQMINHVKASPQKTFFMLTECGLTNRLQSEVPDKTFVGSCTMCRYMKANNLSDIERVLTAPDTEDIIEIDAETRQKSVACIDAMFHYATLK